jgi:hypothetical protein
LLVAAVIKYADNALRVWHAALSMGIFWYALDGQFAVVWNVMWRHPLRYLPAFVTEQSVGGCSSEGSSSSASDKRRREMPKC